MNWQPIETAPKDRRILLWFPRELFNDMHVICGNWYADEYSLSPRPHWDHDLSRLYGKVMTRSNQPTHWAEIPEGPR